MQAGKLIYLSLPWHWGTVVLNQTAIDWFWHQDIHIQTCNITSKLPSGFSLNRFNFGSCTSCTLPEKAWSWHSYSCFDWIGPNMQENKVTESAVPFGPECSFLFKRNSMQTKKNNTINRKGFLSLSLPAVRIFYLQEVFPPRGAF